MSTPAYGGIERRRGDSRPGRGVRAARAKQRRRRLNRYVLCRRRAVAAARLAADPRQGGHSRVLDRVHDDRGRRRAVLESHEIEAAGDLAYCVGRYSGTIGGQASQGKYVVVFRKQADGRYKAIADCFNADA